MLIVEVIEDVVRSSHATCYAGTLFPAPDVP